MKVVNKELGLLVDMSERQAQICLKRNPRKYTLPESVEEIELDEDEEPAPKATIKAPAETPQVTTGGVIKAKTKDVQDVQPLSVEEANAKADASKGAIDLANENGINLNDIGIEGRIMKTDVENYLNSK